MFSNEAFFLKALFCFMRDAKIIAARIQKYHTVSYIETCYWLALCQPATVYILFPLITSLIHSVFLAK